jgi:hypothetical protein
MKRPGHEITWKRLRHGPMNQCKDLKLQEYSSPSLLANVQDIENELMETRDMRIENGTSGLTVKLEEVNTKPDPCRGSRLSDVQCILKELRKITQKYHAIAEEDEVKNEWKFAAMVIDRACLYFCIMMTIVSTVAILFSAPHLIA